MNNNVLFNEKTAYFDANNYVSVLPKSDNAICVLIDKKNNECLYVGTNRENGNFQKRLRELFQGKGRCSFRNSIMYAYKMTKVEAVAYIKQNIKFALIEVNDRSLRNQLTNRLIVSCQPKWNKNRKNGTDITEEDINLLNNCLLKNNK